jgi:hypothetical protein
MDRSGPPRRAIHSVQFAVAVTQGAAEMGRKKQLNRTSARRMGCFTCYRHSGVEMARKGGIWVEEGAKEVDCG